MLPKLAWASTLPLVYRTVWASVVSGQSPPVGWPDSPLPLTDLSV